MTRAATARKCDQIVPGDVPGIDQPDVGFVHQRRGLEAVPRSLAGHAAPGDAMELAVHERNQPLQGSLVALRPLHQQPGSPSLRSQ